MGARPSVLIPGRWTIEAQAVKPLLGRVTVMVTVDDGSTATSRPVEALVLPPDSTIPLPDLVITSGIEPHTLVLDWTGGGQAVVLQTRLTWNPETDWRPLGPISPPVVLTLNTPIAFFRLSAPERTP
jgi:hypothetical protein